MAFVDKMDPVKLVSVKTGILKNWSSNSAPLRNQEIFIHERRVLSGKAWKLESTMQYQKYIKIFRSVNSVRYISL